MKKEFIFSLKRPFENWRTATIGIIISALIILFSIANKFSKDIYIITINAFILVFFDLILAGFNVENIHNILKKKKLPKFDKLGKKIWYGIILYVISIIYQLPGLILLVFGLYLNSLISIISGITLLLIVYFVQMSSIIEYSKKYKIKDAFKWENFKKGYSKTFIAYGIIGIILSIIFSILLALTIVGIFIIPWFVGIFEYTFLALGYKKIKK